MVIADDIFSLKSFDVIVVRNIRLGIESSISGYIRTLSECSLNIEYIWYIVYYIEDGVELIYYNLAIIIVIILSLNIPRFSYQCELSKEHINSKQFLDIIQLSIFQIVFIYSSANLSLAKSSNTILSSSSSPKLFWYFILSELLVFFNTPFCGCLGGAVQSSDAEVENYFYFNKFIWNKRTTFFYLDSGA